MVDGGECDTGRPFGVQKNILLRKFLENYLIFFPNWFWSPKKSFKDFL